MAEAWFQAAARMDGRQKRVTLKSCTYNIQSENALATSSAEYILNKTLLVTPHKPLAF
jgi:hypothetical protein